MDDMLVFDMGVLVFDIARREAHHHRKQHTCWRPHSDRSMICRSTAVVDDDVDDAAGA